MWFLLHLVFVISCILIDELLEQSSTSPWHVHMQYNYWSQKQRRVELVVLEMYEGNRQSNSTAFSSFHPPPPPIVMRQAYIFPGHIATMATTVTEKGITNKELLCELQSDDS